VFRNGNLVYVYYIGVSPVDIVKAEYFYLP